MDKRILYPLSLLFLAFIGFTRRQPVIPFTASADKRIVVAVIDTGLNPNDTRFKSLLCKDHTMRDYTGEGINDIMGHGTQVVGLIKEYAGSAKFCLRIYKYFSFNMSQDNVEIAYLNAVKQAYQDGADFINISSNGPYSEDEHKMIHSNSSTVFVVASGNHGVDLDKVQEFPASYPGVVAVSSLGSKGGRVPSSNYGSKVVWERGENVMSTTIESYCGYPEDLYRCRIPCSGTSFAAPIRTGKMVLDRYKKSQDALNQRGLK